MYVIMGATGNIGSKVANVLLDKGEKVTVIGRSAERLQPFVDRGAIAATGDIADASFLTKAFREADAVFAMLPPDYQTKDFRMYYNELGDSIVAAIQESGVKYVVFLSSHGAHLPDKTGPVKGLHDVEQKLNKLDDVNVLHLRPTNFMENLLANIGMIKNMGITGGGIKADGKFPMVATKDIAPVAAEYLVNRGFPGKTAQELLGERDVTMNEVTKVFGEKIGKPDLGYVQFSPEDEKKGLMELLNYSLRWPIETSDRAEITRWRECSKKSVQQGRSPFDARSVHFVREHGKRARTPLAAFFNIPLMDFGMSDKTSDQLVELSQAINDGIMAVNRTANNTTGTSIEEFAEFFAQVYKSS